MAQNPALNVHTLYQQATAIAPFQPTLANEPNDFTVAVTFAAGLSTPTAMAADAAGNLWVTNSGNNTLAQLSPTGLLLSGPGYTNLLNAPSSVAVATDGTVWVTNKGNNTVSRFTAAGAAYAAPYVGGGLNSPSAIAFDGFGTAWIANQGNSSVTSIDSAGGSATNYTPAGTASPVAILLNPH